MFQSKPKKQNLITVLSYEAVIMPRVSSPKQECLGGFGGVLHPYRGSGAMSSLKRYLTDLLTVYRYLQPPGGLGYSSIDWEARNFLSCLPSRVNKYIIRSAPFHPTGSNPLWKCVVKGLLKVPFDRGHLCRSFRLDPTANSLDPMASWSKNISMYLYVSSLFWHLPRQLLTILSFIYIMKVECKSLKFP